MTDKIKRTERGWAGHYICASDCLFRRNTLLESSNAKIVVSSVGLMKAPQSEGDRFYKGKFEKIGSDRYYETMAFHANPNDTRYHGADVSRGVVFDSPWAISELDADDKANDMHEVVVAEITKRMEVGEYE